jgi:hypothetical protein
MNEERIGPDFGDEPAHLLRRHLARLHHAEISEHERRRSDVAHAEGGALARIDVHGALASKTEAIAARFGDRRELAVDGRRALDAAGHRCDDDRSAQLFAEEGHRGVDAIRRELRQRLMNELDAFEERRRSMKADVAGGGEVDVVRLALPDSAAGHATISSLAQTSLPRPAPD